jgi:beta-xylosidase
VPCHDPWILAHAPTKTYYLYTSAQRAVGIGRSGTVAYTSKDLVHWDGPVVVFVVPDGAWANPRHGAWAPEVHEYRGKYYLFTTLHNRDALLAQPPDVWKVQHLRGTVVARSDTPAGPFELLKPSGPHPPRQFMTLDGTLWIDEQQQPWMVYCHEWIQTIDGTVEAIRLKDDLSDVVGDPSHLFKGSDAPWKNAQIKPSTHPLSYVTDGPELFRTKAGTLLMLWSSYGSSGYVQTQARSKSATLEGPWEQLDPLVTDDSGHGMLFRTFGDDVKLMLVLHHPMEPPSRARLYEVEDAGDRLRIVKRRNDLDGQ